MKREDHLEISDGDTLIVSKKVCPLQNPIEGSIHPSSGVICCRNGKYICPGFYKAYFNGKDYVVDCRIDGEETCNEI